MLLPAEEEAILAHSATLFRLAGGVAGQTRGLLAGGLWLAWSVLPDCGGGAAYPAGLPNWLSQQGLQMQCLVQLSVSDVVSDCVSDRVSDAVSR